MPRSAPLYPSPPYLYQGNRQISVTFRTTLQALQGLIPPPLVPNPQSRLFIYVAQFHVVAPFALNYMEAGIGVPASLSDTAGQYAVYLYLDKATAIVPGREIYGWPKKDAEISITDETEDVSAKVVRDGVMLIEATVKRSVRVDPIPKQPSAPWFNLKLIPSVKKDAPPDVMQLTSTLTGGETKELYTGSAALKFGSSAADPLGDIPIVEILGGSYSISDLTLGYGDVIYDYLGEGEP